MSFTPVDAERDDDAIVAEINVTPLTDIFLVLLIIFMVTSTALVQQGTKVNLPRAGTGGSEIAGIVLTATADRRVEINGKAVSMQELPEVLKAALLASDDRSVVLQGDRAVVLEQAVQLLNLAKEAGAERVAIATAPENAPAARK